MNSTELYKILAIDEPFMSQILAGDIKTHALACIAEILFQQNSDAAVASLCSNPRPTVVKFVNDTVYDKISSPSWRAAEQLVRNKFPLERLVKDNHTVLSVAFQNGRMATADILFDAGANPESVLIAGLDKSQIVRLTAMKAQYSAKQAVVTTRTAPPLVGETPKLAAAVVTNSTTDSPPVNVQTITLTDEEAVMFAGWKAKKLAKLAAEKARADKEAAESAKVVKLSIEMKQQADLAQKHFDEMNKKKVIWEAETIAMINKMHARKAKYTRTDFTRMGMVYDEYNLYVKHHAKVPHQTKITMISGEIHVLDDVDRQKSGYYMRAGEDCIWHNRQTNLHWNKIESIA